MSGPEFFQIVWAQTCAVGCGASNCPDVEGESGWVFVCNYAPGYAHTHTPTHTHTHPHMQIFLVATSVSKSRTHLVTNARHAPTMQPAWTICAVGYAMAYAFMTSFSANQCDASGSAVTTVAPPAAVTTVVPTGVTVATVAPSPGVALPAGQLSGLGPQGGMLLRPQDFNGRGMTS